MSQLIFKTVHGSHLYGLSNIDSDIDTFWVGTQINKRAEHYYNAVERTALARVGITRFLFLAKTGSHQSVEALMSREKIWNPAFQNVFSPMLDNLKVCGAEVFEKYERTIKAFCFGDFKHRRHAVRLSQNLEALRDCGRFNPRMNEAQINDANFMAEHYEGADLFQKLMD